MGKWLEAPHLDGDWGGGGLGQDPLLKLNEGQRASIDPC